MAKKKSIEELRCDDYGIIKEHKDGYLTSQMLDEELDVIDCTFHFDGCVHIDTRGLQYITLSIDNLRELRNLIIEAEKIFINNCKR